MLSPLTCFLDCKIELLALERPPDAKTDPFYWKGGNVMKLV